MSKLIKIFLLSTGAVLAAYVGISLFGSLNQEPTIIEETTLVDGTPEQTWKVLTTPSQYPEWLYFVSKADRAMTADGHDLWGIGLKNGEVLAFVYTEEIPKRRFTLTQQLKGSRPFYFRLTFEVVPAGQKTQVLIRQEQVGLTAYAQGMMKLKEDQSANRSVLKNVARALTARVPLLQPFSL